ncbi:Acetylene hydratase [Sporomusa ovata DSM 2662]|uniref:Anaerobic dehydrogenases, typically selenocysteine-containing n=1 Tax=Sporomusa ovata TaxID=2378 RepID=A0A0U1KWU6_9FIRM|nr:molybdopterin-dependent oxidoreductase [Sporomusa ovata]EQB28766.1 molybdopterin oxidoreductase BisC [Sporomusa ovata DSM 2662]CQR71920.1 Anaerobic dehydrogenases, typically selenocysteine-containing [Sporomusa ovata]
MSRKSRNHPAICGVCPGGCAIEATVENERLTEVKPLAGAPFGSLCVRGKHAAEVVYSPDRLKTPLLRTGARGEGKFRPASWDEALSLLTDKILAIRDDYGPQALVNHSGRGCFETSMDEIGSTSDAKASKLLLPLGSPNACGVGSVCFVAFGLLAPMTTLGVRGQMLVPDWDKNQTLVIWGTNPATDSPPFGYQRILKAQKRGMRVIVIDQMKSDMAARADQWIPVRSGTDGALALGMIRAMIKEGLYDQEFVDHWTVGFDELVKYVEDFSPEKVASITGVPVATMLSLARTIATTPTGLRLYTGLEYSNCGVQSIRAVYILWALAGKLDAPGGLLIETKSEPYASLPAIEMPKELPIGATEYPLFYKYTGCGHFMEFPKAVLEEKPYAVKGLINSGSSILTSYPQPALYEEAFRKLEFMAVVDRFMTRDALFADVVLPATTYFENTSYQHYPGYTRLRRQVISPVGEARNDLFIMAEIAKRLGYGHMYPQNEEEMLEMAFARNPELLAELKTSQDGVAVPKREQRYKKYELGLLRPDGKPGFDTPSGKLEIASSILAEHGYAALPEYIEPVEGPLGSPDVYCEYPLILNTGARIHSTFRSQHLNIPGLVKLQPRPAILIHPDDAKQRGITAGDKVTVKTRRGQVNLYACITDQVMQGSVEANMGGGTPSQAPEWRDANVNTICDFINRDPISGFPVFKTQLCQVEKAELALV